MPKKPIWGIEGWTREIVMVSFDESGSRIEEDFDLLPPGIQEEIRKAVNERGLSAAGYVRAKSPAEERNKAI